MTMLTTVLAIGGLLQSQSLGPVEFGERELRAALAEKGILAKVQTHIYSGLPGPPPEGYDLAFSKGLVGVAANDANGLMYGLLEAAERIRNGGKDAWKQPVVHGKPYLADRGWNIFLPLPWDYEKNFVDNDPAALTDPKRWFFMDDHYWQTLFDQMARSRLNWLDIHGPYDLDTTRFPNLYAYFIQSERFPKVGVAPEIKATLLKQLNRIIAMAHNRGIKVSLMSYEARFDVPHNPRPGYQGTEAEVYDYTKEVVEKMIRQCPKLDKIGYRIGESGRGPEFFKCYTEAIAASGRDIPVYTRSWVTTKARVLPLARASSDFTVEIKYNGEHWGAPYIMQGGRVAGWYSYFWEDYLSYSGPEGKRMWPGIEGEVTSYGGEVTSDGGEVTSDELRVMSARTDRSRLPKASAHPAGAPFDPNGAPFDPNGASFDPNGAPFDPRRARFGPSVSPSDSGTSHSSLEIRHSSLETRNSRWPSQPYKIVWQVRANGTHRIFPFYQPHWTRSSILSMKVGTTSGYTVESMASYFPQEPRYYLNPAFVRSESIRLMSPIGPISPIGHPSTGDAPYKWIHQRDEMYMACWGRLGYDPAVPDWKFDAMLVRKYGREVGRPLAEAWKAASKVVPIAFMAYSLGPDHRNHAPELEWGGDTEAYLQGEPFDSHVFRNAREAVAYRVTDGKDGRIDPSEAAAKLQFLEVLFGSFGAKSIPALAGEHAAIRLLRSLGFYYASRFRTAEALALLEAGVLKPDDDLLLDTNPRSASSAWRSLSESDEAAYYRPFSDRLRMRRHDFHWARELASVESDSARMAELIPKHSGPPLSRGMPSMVQPPWGLRLACDWDSGRVRASLPAKSLTRASLLEKPLPSSTFFHKTTMKRVGDQFVAEFKREPWGHCVAAEIEMEGGTIRRIPWWEDGTPYLTVPSMEKPTPFIYSAEEAMRYLKPEILDPEKYGWLVVAQRGWMFHTRFDTPTKRKLLSAVERGMNLLVMQQDYTSGRYPLDWLPVKPKLVNRQDTVFDPGGALGMEKVETRDVLWQAFERGNRTNTTYGTDKTEKTNTSYESYSDSDWQIFGNGGVARLKHGKGEIWMVQARFNQRLHIPGVARNLLALLRNTCPEARDSLSLDGEGRGVGDLRSRIGSGATGLQARGNGSPTPQPPPSRAGESQRRPAILVDTGTEGAHYVTSVIPDFMNAHDLPFLTLGEVIAKEQGMDSTTVVPGPVSDDNVLGGKGPEIMKAFLESKVKNAAARPLPKTREEMEARKPADRKELLRMMGLDPLPPRTPLNARITGVIQRPGYRIEKLVFESRPGFFVTAHLYVPEPAIGDSRFETESGPSALRSELQIANRRSRHPVILNVHGHWPVKKQTEVVQSRAIFQALRGYVAIVIDTPGHSFESATAPIERRWQGNHNDWFLLLGSANTTALYAWDVIRALDYLETRPECDTTRVGITGASGGGLATVYTFAADERIKCAVPVVYATSLEVNPHNGCLCNHVPATLQVGDRSDLMAIRAPNPVLVIGAEVDPEFPPEGTKRTGEKLRAIWRLYGKEDDAQWKVFPGGHDYSKPMRELAMGFFDKNLKGIGDGSPVPEPEFTPIPNVGPELLVLPEFSSQGAKSPIPEGAKTQRDIAKERLAAAKSRTWEEIIQLNGGRPGLLPTNFANVPGVSEDRTYMTYQSEPGLKIPAVLWRSGSKSKATLVLISESGKASGEQEFGVRKLLAAGYDCLAIDVRGLGELLGLDLRLMAYAGTSAPFAMGWDAAVAARDHIRGGLKVVVVGRGSTASQVAMFAALFEPRISAVIGLQGLKEWEDAFEEGVPSHCIMPRADLAGLLSHIRSLVKCPALWTFRGEKDPDLVAAIDGLLGEGFSTRLTKK